MNRTLLIVDDLNANRGILKKLLGDEYRIFEASNGQEALDFIANEYRELSAVLLDLYMPVMDGFAVLAAVRRATPCSSSFP